MITGAIGQTDGLLLGQDLIGGNLQIMRLVTLIEDTQSAHRGLFTEHGLSFYLETEHTRLLFDFGESGRMLDNMVKLNIPAQNLDYAVCSHAHYDHGGGFKYVLQHLPISKLVTGEGFWTPKYAAKGHKYTYLGHGFEPELLHNSNVEHMICTDVLQLSEDCWAVGNFERETPYEQIPDRFVLEVHPGEFEKDPFSDEICIAVETGEGLAVILGCSHPGIINMLRTVHRRLNRPIHSVWGGSHLVEGNPERVHRTAQALKGLGVQRVGLCHCTGDAALEQLQKELCDTECCRIGTGDTVFL